MDESAVGRAKDQDFSKSHRIFSERYFLAFQAEHYSFDTLITQKTVKHNTALIFFLFFLINQQFRDWNNLVQRRREEWNLETLCEDSACVFVGLVKIDETWNPKNRFGHFYWKQFGLGLKQRETEGAHEVSQRIKVMKNQCVMAFEFGPSQCDGIAPSLQQSPKMFAQLKLRELEIRVCVLETRDRKNRKNYEQKLVSRILGILFCLFCQLFSSTDPFA